jgi:hypothetical protein
MSRDVFFPDNSAVTFSAFFKVLLSELCGAGKLVEGKRQTKTGLTAPANFDG